MNSRQIFAAIKELKERQVAAVADGNAEDALRLDGEIRAREADLAAAIEAEDAIRNELKAAVNPHPLAFAAAARKLFKVEDVLTEGTGSQGGYTVPAEVLTKVYKLKNARTQLRDLVRVKNVSTKSGSEVVLTHARQAAWTATNENNSIAVGTDPTFALVEWAAKKYGGLYPATEELFEDSDENIEQILTEWLAEAEVATENSIILNKFSFTSASTYDSIDDIKYAINVTLGQAYKPNCTIITNDDGLNILDTIKVGSGRNDYVLQPDPVEPMKQWLCVGTVRVPLFVVPNATLASSETYGAPFIIGDIHEALTLYDRRNITIKQSDSASYYNGSATVSAFQNDQIVFKGTCRKDVQIVDSAAYTTGYWSFS